MSTVINGAIGMRKARYVRNRADEISEDLACEEAASRRQRQLLDDVQSLVWDCTALGLMWRSAIKYIGQAAADREIADYPAIGEVLRSALKQTVSNYERVARLVQLRQEAGQTIRDLADFQLAVHEVGNIGDWLDCWSSNDAELRAKIREEIRSGQSSPAEAFVRSLQESA